jgi:hypothetical protein
MYRGGSLEYQFAAASLIEMMRDLANMVLPPLADDMAAL